jgi:GTP cyclohydrolase I
MALIYDMSVTVAYVPRDRIIGLSKIARIAETAARRLQVQERLTADIAEIMTLAANTEDVAVFISGKHSCMTARGIKNRSAVTDTSKLCGVFTDNETMRRRLYDELAFGRQVPTCSGVAGVLFSGDSDVSAKGLSLGAIE